MFLRVTVCTLLAVCFLSTEYAEAGSSFLSPADLHKPQPRKSPKNLTPNVQRRDSEDFWDAYREQSDAANEEREMKLNVPFEIRMKMSEQQYQAYGQVLQEILQELFSENKPELAMGNE